MSNNALSEVCSDPAPIAHPSLWAMLDAGVEGNEDKIAVTVMHQPASRLAHLKPATDSQRSQQPKDEQCLQWTFAELRYAALRLATGFLNKGVKRGSTVVTFLPNGIECVLMRWVSAVVQLTLAPLDATLLHSGREAQLEGYLRRLKPEVVVVPDGKAAEALNPALGNPDEWPALQIFCEAGAASVPSRWQALVNVANDAEPSTSDRRLNQDPALDRDGKRTALILFTSGTSTGKPKGCPRNVRNVLYGATNDFLWPALPSRFIVHTPNSGAICQAFLGICGSSGRHMVMSSPAFNPAATLDAVERFAAELMVAIPLMARTFSAELAKKPRDVSSIRHVAVGGDMTTIEAVAKFKECFPNAEVRSGHGMTEGHSLLGWGHVGASLEQSSEHYHGILSLGYAGPGALVRVCDGGRRPVPRGEAGELHLGGPFVIDHYLDDAQPEAFYRDEKGSWLLTGDRAVMSEDGKIFVIGRSKDIIKRVGVSLSPAVIESVLNGVDGVEASVFGVPHPDLGEAPVAVVAGSNGEVDLDRIRRAVSDGLGAAYALDDAVPLRDLGYDAWPLNQTGKIVKHELKSAYLSSKG